MPMTTEAIKGFLEASLQIVERQGIAVSRITAEALRISQVVKFERFFAVLADYFGSAPRDLAAKLYSGCEPNPNHEAVARLVEIKHRVYTTNFDENVEARVHGDTSNFSHLHGLASQPDSMVLTMKQLADQGRPILESLRRDLVETGRLACIGYSGTGDIDILPILKNAEDDVLTFWFDRPGFLPPTRGRVFHHDLCDSSNVLFRWTDLRDSVPEWLDSEDVISMVRELVHKHFSGFPPTLMLRALASVAHEARFGRLAVELYGVACEVGGQSAVSDYEWGVAYERANEHKLAAEHLERAAEGSSGAERAGHRAGAAFCYRQLGQLMKSKKIYDKARSELSGAPQRTLAHVDNVIRGRIAVYTKLAAGLPRASERHELVEQAGLVEDLALLRSADDPLEERSGRLDLLQEFAAFELDVLLEHKSRAELRDIASRLWVISKGHQDLEVQAKAARLVSAVSKGQGRARIVETLVAIWKTGASKRDLGKLLLSLALTLLPFSPGRWQLLNPTDHLRLIFKRNH